MNKKYFIIIVLLITTVIYYVPFIKSPLSPYDEAVILVGAERVMDGQVPYKDFLTVYAPGQVYTLATIFKIFGTSVTVERIYDIAIKSILSLLIFLIIKMLSSNKTALVGWAASLIWIEYCYNHAYPVYASVLFTLLCIYFLLFHMKYEKPLYIVLSAVSIVCAILFRHDLGGLAAIAIALALLLRKAMGVEKSWTPFFTYLAVCVITALPVIVLFLIYSDINAIIEDLIIFPLDMVANQQSFPYPPLTRWNLPFYVFPSFLLLGIITFFITIRRKMDYTLAYGILLISITGIVFLNQAWGRSDTIHIMPAGLSAIVLSPVLFHTFTKMMSRSTRLNSLFFIIFIVFFGITLSKAIEKKTQYLSSNYDIKVINPSIERAKYSYIGPDYKKVVSYIKQNSAENDYIYVGLKNHDQFVFNDAIFYFLAKRKCATKYHELNPGHTTTLKIQKEMIGELKENNPSLIVLATRVRVEANLSGIDTKVDMLDNYIASNFELKATYGEFEIWMKKQA